MTGWLFTPDHLGGVLAFNTWRAAVEGVFGPMPLQALATQTMGLYLGMQYLVPIAGGWLGDRWLGSRRAMLLGLMLLTAGACLLIGEATFLPGLLLLTLGAGTFRCNLNAQTGHLYERDDHRRTAAFAVIATALNIGAFITPLVVGTLGERANWSLGFAVACAGLAVALITAVAGNRAMPPDRLAAVRATARLGPGDGRTIAALLAVLTVASCFWLAQAQVWNVYVLWGRDHLDRHMFGQEMPVTWLQAIDSLAPIVAVPPVLWLWRRQARTGGEPTELGKIGVGCALIAAAFAWLAAGSVATTPVRLGHCLPRRAERRLALPRADGPGSRRAHRSAGGYRNDARRVGGGDLRRQHRGGLAGTLLCNDAGGAVLADPRRRAGGRRAGDAGVSAAAGPGAAALAELRPSAPCADGVAGAISQHDQ